MDSWGFLNELFGGGGGGGYTSSQGEPPLDKGIHSLNGWMTAQAFAGAGPVGQYMGMLYGSPREGIPNTDRYPRDVKAAEQQRRHGYGYDYGNYIDYGDYIDFTKSSYDPHFGQSHYSSSAEPVKSFGEQSQSSKFGKPETFSREGGRAASTTGSIEEVRVFGSPRVQPSPNDWFEKYLASPRAYNNLCDGCIQLPPAPSRPPRPRRPATRKSSPADASTLVQAEPRPERDLVDSGPYGEVTSFTTTGKERASNPWMLDAPAPEQFLSWGSWDRPENVPTPRLERGNNGMIGRIEAVPTVRVERSFWSRGGTGLATGVAVTAGLVVAFTMGWNPIGWAALGATLALAGGVAATTASAVELSASYSDNTSAEQDARMNRAVSAALGYSSPGGVIGGVFGTVLADDPEEGFLHGGMWGGLAEGMTSLPGMLRALPGIWRVAMPWAKSLLLTPIFFSQTMEIGGGIGGVRSLARIFARGPIVARGRTASRVRQIELIGSTPLLERDADWARYQTYITGTSKEKVFRITYTNGSQRIVLADDAYRTGGLLTIEEAKYGNMGQMFIPAKEAHIMRQIRNYIDITTVVGGQVRYSVSTELGAFRLTQRFSRQFPAQMESGQLLIDWRQWPR